MLVSQWCPTLQPMDWILPWTVSCLSMEFSLQESWSEFPFPSPGALPNRGIEFWSLHCTLMGLWKFPLEGQAVGAFIHQLSSPLAEGCLGAGAQCPLLCFWAPSALESPCCLGLGYQLLASLRSPDTSPLQLWLQPEVGPSRNTTLGTRDITTAQSVNTQTPK